MIRTIALLTLSLVTGFASAGPIAAPVPFTSANQGDAIGKQSLGKTVTDSVIVSFNFRYSGVLDNNDFMGLWFGNASSTNTVNYNGPGFGVKANCGASGATTCTTDVFARSSLNGTNKFVADSDLQAGTDYFLMARLYKSGNSEYFNRLDVWLNPTLADKQTLTNPHQSATQVSTLKSVDSIGFRTSNLDRGDILTVSNLRIGEVPEPTSIALMGLALAGLAFTRRNKRA